MPPDKSRLLQNGSFEPVMVKYISHCTAWYRTGWWGEPSLSLSLSLSLYSIIFAHFEGRGDRLGAARMASLAAKWLNGVMTEIDGYVFIAWPVTQRNRKLSSCRMGLLTFLISISSRYLWHAIPTERAMVSPVNRIIPTDLCSLK